MEWIIPLTEPEIGAEEIEAVTRVLKSKWLTMGPVTEEFERQFAAKLGVRHAIAVNSCTSALHLANIACEVGAGDEVICPDLTFVASANASRYTGAKVVFAGVTSIDEPTISPSQIEEQITARTKVITVVHYAGFACRIKEIVAIAKRRGLKVIEDCAHAPFASAELDELEARPVGTIGDVGCFSFFSNKNMTTGEGGMVTTNDDAIAATVRLLRSHGMTTMTYQRHGGHASSYDVVGLGYNYRLDEIRSALGLCQLAKIDSLNERRRQVWTWYRDELEEAPEVTVPFSTRDLRFATPHIMPVFVRSPFDEIRQHLASTGIQTSRHYDLIPDFSEYRGVSPSAPRFGNYQLISLPLGPNMTLEQVRYVTTTLKAFCCEKAMAKGEISCDFR
jgi:dTDP-4-amino-4,6-dideoxygalactose transaminase